MKCPNLTQFGDVLAPCGQCMPCRINKKRFWTGRILLEAHHAGKPSSFVTLTYSDDKLPEGNQLNTQDLQRFLDKCRHRNNVESLRYFGVGEYGSITERPHYHIAIFGLPAQEYEETFTECWQRDGEPIGFVHVGEVEAASAEYLCGYATKKMTSPGDHRLDGRKPEFIRMSKYPPLGAAGIESIKKQLYSKKGAIALRKMGDVPKSFRTYGKIWPLGKYWIDKLREEFGITDPPPNIDWALNPEEFENGQEKAARKAEKLWRNRNKSPNRRI